MISTGERRRQKSVCNGVVECRWTVTQAAESVKMETTAGGRQQSGFIATAADNFQHTQNRRRLFCLKSSDTVAYTGLALKMLKNNSLIIFDCTRIS